MHFRCYLAIALFGLAPLGSAVADEAEDLLEVRNTVINLLQSLVERDILTREEASAMVSKAQADAREQVAAQRAEQPTLEEGDVRVTYIPEVVRDEISAQVSEDVREEVIAGVKADARTEGWGVPEALPAWMRSIALYGDTRVRYQYDAFAEDNAANTYLNFNEVNDAGGITPAGPFAFLNTTEDRSRWVGRIRAGLIASISPNMFANVRLSTGNLQNAVSPNHNYGQYHQKWITGFDLAYLQWNPTALPVSQNLTAGRMENRWSWTDMIWDNDVSMEGIYYGIGNQGPYLQRGFGAAIGYYPMREFELSEEDAWRASAKLSGSFGIGGDSWIALKAAYHYYENISGRRNAPESRLNDPTAAPFFQRGNTTFDIRNDLDPDTNLFALAADYELLNYTAVINGVFPGGNQLRLTADYVQNRGFNEDDVLDRTGVAIEERNEGYLAELRFGKLQGINIGDGGMRDITRGDWALAVTYRSMQRDAVIDAFVDGDFGDGGTDVEGYTLALYYAFLDDFEIRARYMSSSEIDGPPLTIDTLQIDLNARF